MNGFGKISSSLLAVTGRHFHCSNGGRGPSEICQPALKTCLRKEDSKEMYVDNEMFPTQRNISNELFPKINTESRSTRIPKSSSWIVVLISTSSVNAHSCNSDIHVIVTVSLSYLVICHSLS